jgi:hypothetical protein
MLFLHTAVPWCTVVEHLNYNHETGGLNPALAQGEGKMKSYLYMWLYPGSTVVNHLTHYPKNEGLNPATSTG